MDQTKLDAIINRWYWNDEDQCVNGWRCTSCTNLLQIDNRYITDPDRNPCGELCNEIKYTIDMDKFRNLVNAKVEKICVLNQTKPFKIVESDENLRAIINSIIFNVLYDSTNDYDWTFYSEDGEHSCDVSVYYPIIDSLLSTSCTSSLYEYVFAVPIM